MLRLNKAKFQLKNIGMNSRKFLAFSVSRILITKRLRENLKTEVNNILKFLQFQVRLSSNCLLAKN